MVLILFIGFTVSVMTQPVTKPAKKVDSKTSVAPTAKKASFEKVAKVPASAAKSTAPAATKPAVEKQKLATKSDVVLKKDGTPDKRYKNSAKAAGPLKKDGTPDMRYKENKTAK